MGSGSALLFLRLLDLEVDFLLFFYWGERSCLCLIGLSLLTLLNLMLGLSLLFLLSRWREDLLLNLLLLLFLEGSCVWLGLRGGAMLFLWKSIFFFWFIIV